MTAAMSAPVAPAPISTATRSVRDDGGVRPDCAMRSASTHPQCSRASSASDRHGRGQRVSCEQSSPRLLGGIGARCSPLASCRLNDAGPSDRREGLSRVRVWGLLAGAILVWRGGPVARTADMTLSADGRAAGGAGSTDRGERRALIPDPGTCSYSRLWNGHHPCCCSRGCDGRADGLRANGRGAGAVRLAVPSGDLPARSSAL